MFAKTRHTAIITRKYCPVLLLLAPPNPPARRSANGAATRGPIKAIIGAIVDTSMDSSLESPISFMCTGKNGYRLPTAEKIQLD